MLMEETLIIDNTHFNEHGQSELLSWCWENIEGIGMVLLPGREYKPEAAWTMKYLPDRQVEFRFRHGADATMFALKWA